MASTVLNNLYPEQQRLDRPGIQPDVGMKPPSWAGDVVSMTDCNDVLYVACQRGVFVITASGIFKPISFSSEPAALVFEESQDSSDRLSEMTDKEYEAYRSRPYTAEEIADGIPEATRRFRRQTEIDA